MINDATKMRILIIDDVPENITILQNILIDQYIIQVALRGEKALALAATDPCPDLILLDIMMPDMDGYQVCAQLKSFEKTKNIPVIFLTALNDEANEAKGLDLGAVDYITKPFSPVLVKARLKNHLDLKRHRDHLSQLVEERTREVRLTQEAAIESLGSLAEHRDQETGDHIKRTKTFIRLLAEHLKDHPTFRNYLTASTIDRICISAPLHDIGKVGVPDHILRKPGKLTPAEFEEIKKHPLYGKNALRVASRKLGNDSFLAMAEAIAYTHHEKWDGSGYPNGLKGNAIPLAGRLMALADVYDALSSQRVYKPAFPHDMAVTIINEGCGTHFDPDLVAAFNEIHLQFQEVALLLRDN